MHRAARETIHQFPVVGFDLVNRVGNIIASASSWDALVAGVPRMLAGDYQIVDSNNLRKGSIQVFENGAWIIRGMPRS
jgi:hypothetical protein